MQEQICNGLWSHYQRSQRGRFVHYALHQVVVWKHAETTEMRIVYYCSSRANASPSLKDCLETGPPGLKPSLFHIMLRNRMRKYCVNGDIQKAFLEIRVQGRNAQRVLRQRVSEHHIRSYLKPSRFQGGVYWDSRITFKRILCQ